MVMKFQLCKGEYVEYSLYVCVCARARARALACACEREREGGAFVKGYPSCVICMYALL